LLTYDAKAARGKASAETFVEYAFTSGRHGCTMAGSSGIDLAYEWIRSQFASPPL